MRAEVVSLGRLELCVPLYPLSHSEFWISRRRAAPERVYCSELSANEPLIVEMARTEVQAPHPGVLALMELNPEWRPAAEVPGQGSIVRELPMGPPLSRLLGALCQAKTNLSLGAALTLTSQLADAMHHVHTKVGAIHGALDLDRVTVEPDGRVKLFGFLGEPRGLAWTVEQQRFWSPEHLRGEPLSPRSDVFALGALLFELITGRSLFSGRSLFELTQSVLRPERWVPSKLDRSAAWGIDRIIERATALDPDERFPTAAALQRAIDEQAEAVDGPSGPPAQVEVVATWGRAHVEWLTAELERLRGEPVWSSPSEKEWVEYRRARRKRPWGSFAARS